MSQNLCEKALIDSITPINVANMLMIADTFSCDILKKAGLAYVEENPRSIVKTIAWKVMEHVRASCVSYIHNSSFIPPLNYGVPLSYFFLSRFQG